MEATNPEKFAHPTKKCDIVMKGGITSGVVYPAAVCELAETYRFMNIGGTSAGAIAAAATAAAEYRRQRNATADGAGFEALARLPKFLADSKDGHTNLFWLFQPDVAGSLLFEVAARFTKDGVAGAVKEFLRRAPAVWIFPTLVLSGFVLTALLSNEWALSLGAGIGWAALLFLGCFAMVLFRELRRLPESGFGLCSGKKPSGSTKPALCDWLCDFLNDVAGKPANQPLTFGDLNSVKIQLRMITTNVTHGRPYGLPIDTANFYYKEDELAQYFPKSVMKWMREHEGPASKRDHVDAAGFRCFPHAADLPVVVAVRMSLSFPFLFRAVPLYSVDYSLLRLKEGDDHSATNGPGAAIAYGKLRVPERCWFLDGGVCSNFPISMFDAVLPTWPTFAINLQELRKDRPDEVWMPTLNSEGLNELWNRIPESPGLGSVVAYVFAMISAARNWMDNRQMTVPGYRDRIVHIRLDESREGGLKLDMDQETVTTLMARGVKAAEALKMHFDTPAPGIELTWDNHRWIRFRSMFDQVERILGDIQAALQGLEPGELSYEELLHRRADDPPNSYRVNAAQRDTIQHCLDVLSGLAENIQGSPVGSRPSLRAPRPVPQMRLLPSIVPPRDADQRSEPPVDPPAEGAASVEPAD